MTKKKKFNPEITRIKLNPEQAVLTCTCHNSGYKEAISVGSKRAMDSWPFAALRGVCATRAMHTLRYNFHGNAWWQNFASLS